ncbi:hypothetical protein LQ327_06435 [Actinomycetospora endophytica]|uniref:Uncharacterized protein n=1 Tax=Actinomycetospora endophytica TaxID=2291215 RepID=A0ABS8P469_9PSEU|nr:hypothetical protein [Actinomycetospora endophytica]MCD2193026.1 hypothetical protein [Actinomycetospora endophytica]
MTATAEWTGEDGHDPATTGDPGDPAAPTGTATRSVPATQPHRTVLHRLDDAASGLVVTGLDDEARAVLVRGLRRAGRRVLVVATTAADAVTWRRELGEPAATTHGVAPGLTGTEDEIAERLAATAGADGWLTVLLGLAEEVGDGAPPLDAPELADLRRLLLAEHGTRPGLDGARRRQVLPPPAELPPEPHVDQLADELLDVAGPASSPDRESARPLIAALACLPPDGAGSLDPLLRRIDEGVVALGRAGEDAAWARHVIDGVLAGRTAAAWSRVAGALPEVAQVSRHDHGSGPAQVRVTDDGVDPGTAAEAFERFADFLDTGGTLRRMFKSEEQRAVELLLPSLAINRVDPTTAEGAAAVGHHLRLRELEAGLATALAGLGRTVRPAEQRALLVHRLLSLRELCLRIGTVVDAVTELRTLLTGLPDAVRPATDGLPALGRVVGTGRRLTARASADLARRELGDVVARLNAVASPADRAPELRAALTALLRLDVDAYARAVEAADLARDEQRDLRRSDALAARLTDRPALLEALDADTSDETWIPREERWSQAWAHRDGLTWLRARTPGVVTTTAALAGREQAATADVDLVVLGPVDDEDPPTPWGERPDDVLELPGFGDDGRRLLVLPRAD